MKSFVMLVGLILVFQVSIGFAQTIVSKSDDDFSKQASQYALNDLNRKTLAERNERAVGRMLDLLEKSPSIYGHLELADYQKKEIDRLRTDYTTRLAKLESTEAYRGEFGRRKSEFRKQLNKEIGAVLLPGQMKLIASLNTGLVGLPKALTESPVGKILELSDLQKERIRKSSDELAKKIHDFIHETRKESFEVIASELSAEQLKTLRKVFGESKFDQHIESARLETLFRDYLYNKDSIPGLKNFPSPNHSLLRTELMKSFRDSTSEK